VGGVVNETVVIVEATDGDAEVRATGAEVPWPEVVATVRAQMRSFVGATSELEDLTQAALERVVRSLDRFERRSTLATYSYRICARVAMNHWRGWRRWLRRFAPDIDALDEGHRSTDESPAALTLERERARRLHAALDRVGAKKRAVLTLVDLEGLEVARVAEILDCPAPTVRSRLRAARNDLVAILGHDPCFAAEQEGEATR